MAEHCWHGTNIVLTSYPAQYPQVCCNCGAERRKTSQIQYEDGHGPFADPVERHTPLYLYQDELGERPCEPK